MNLLMKNRELVPFNIIKCTRTKINFKGDRQAKRIVHVQ